MNDNLLETISTSTKPVLVEFYATWCPHCRAMMPVMNRLVDETKEMATVAQIDGDKDEALVEKFHVHSYPTFILFKDGQEAWRDSGEKPYSELKDMIDRFA
ncbi:MAG: thioredoxin family protein [Duncaniella sp.]|nr:thioredoxin family protein [Duncaniella sp.]